MDKTEKYNIASIDIHGHGCDVTELKHVPVSYTHLVLFNLLNSITWN